MRRFLSALLITLTAICFSISESYADTYKILRLNTSTITIGGKKLKVGDTFNDVSDIKWDNDKQAMEVRNTETGALYKFSKKVFNIKGVSGSVADFLLKTSKASSRDLTMPVEVKKSPVADQYPEKRLALVIGNSNYDNLSYLRNAQKDASDVAETLLSLGFDVIEIYEANFQDMMTALNKFASQSGGYDVALFYYAGHGTQYEGKNYLLPVNFENMRRSDLNYTLHADDVLQRMADSGVPTQLIFIDACRDIPTSWTRDSSKGLARMEGARGSVIIFSTESGKTADDGDGDNSPFAASLINNLSKAVSFDETISGLSRDTYELTGHKQFPMRVGGLITDFRFNPSGQELAKIEVPAQKPEEVASRQSNQNTPSPQKSQTAQNSQSDRISQSPTPPQSSEPNYLVSTDNPNVNVRLANIMNSGNNCVLELVVTNKTNKTLSPALSEFLNNYSTMATTIEGDVIQKGDIRTFAGDKNAELGFTLPPNVPVKLRVTIENITKEEFGFLCLCFTNFNPDIPDTSGIIIVSADNFSVLNTGNHGFSVKCDDPKIKVSVSRVVRSGNNTLIDLVLQNTGNKTLKPNMVYASNNNMASTFDGDIFNWGKIRALVGAHRNAILGFTLPPKVPVKMKVTIEDCDNPDTLAYLNLHMSNMGTVADGNITLTRQ